jgi:hypothetical protein
MDNKTYKNNIQFREIPYFWKKCACDATFRVLFASISGTNKRITFGTQTRRPW